MISDAVKENGIRPAWSNVDYCVPTAVTINIPLADITRAGELIRALLGKARETMVHGIVRIRFGRDTAGIIARRRFLSSCASSPIANLEVVECQDFVYVSGSVYDGLSPTQLDAIISPHDHIFASYFDDAGHGGALAVQQFGISSLAIGELINKGGAVVVWRVIGCEDAGLLLQMFGREAIIDPLVKEIVDQKSQPSHGGAWA